MAFQVREFECDPEDDDCLWKFKLSNISHSQLDFYSQEASSRCLKHLARDIVLQLDQAIDKKHKTPLNKTRTIRKLTEKMLKQLKVNIEAFALSIGEQKETVLGYFGKKLAVGEGQQRLEEKCKQWILSSWMAMQPQEFYNTTHRFMQSYFKDGKKSSPDFEALNEIYVVTVGDHFQELPDATQQNNENLVLVDINLNINEQYLSENFLWDSEDISNIRINNFTSHFLTDILRERGIDLDKEAYHELERDTRTQIRAQILYKTLLKRYAHILLNFSSMDIPSEAKEYMIMITLKLYDEKGATIFEDQFEWDIMNESNNVEEFVGDMVSDSNLPERYNSELCYKIRTQINRELEWKLQLLVKTFRSIHRDRESPKLNTQTITVLRRNLAFAMDVNMPCMEQQNYKVNPNIYFNNSDLFSLLSRNVDILPEGFQEILMCKEIKNVEKGSSRVTKEEADDLLKKNGQLVQTNPYLASLLSTNQLHSVWRNALSK